MNLKNVYKKSKRQYSEKSKKKGKKRYHFTYNYHLHNIKSVLQ